MAHGSPYLYPALPSPRVSAWLADMEDWDADDAEVFVATLGRATPASPSRAALDDAPAAERSA
jgi:hypothetical protein